MKCIAPVYAKGTTRSYPTYVPCGKCGYCLRNRQLDWTFRLSEEFRQSAYQSIFVTLTYNNQHLPWTDDFDEVTLLTKDLQLFLKRMRIYQWRKTRALEQIRYYAAGEYGERFGRPHYHLIMFNVHPDTLAHITDFWVKPTAHKQKNPPSMGIMDVQLVNDKTAIYSYVAAYVVNAWSNAKRKNKRPFSTMSKKPYLGATYVGRMRAWHKEQMLPYLPLPNDRKQRLPRTFKNKIFDQAELNSFKAPALVQADLSHNRWLHELYLIHGDELSAFTAAELTLIHNERKILQRAKHVDKYEYQSGKPSTSRSR
jgi:hypothetical protein